MLDKDVPPWRWPCSVWDGKEFRYVSRQRVDQLIHYEAYRSRAKAWEATESGKQSKHKSYLKYAARRKANGGRPLGGTHAAE